MERVNQVDKLKIYIPTFQNRIGGCKNILKENKLKIAFIEKVDVMAVSIGTEGMCLIGNILAQQADWSGLIESTYLFGRELLKASRRQWTRGDRHRNAP